MKGEVIGITALSLTEGQNLNFAIPSKRIADLKIVKPKTLEKWNESANQKSIKSAEESYSAGLRLLWEEKHEQALKYFLKAIEKNSSYYEAYFMVGLCNSYMEHYKDVNGGVKPRRMGGGVKVRHPAK